MENHIKYQYNIGGNKGQVSYNKGNQFVLLTIPRTSALSAFRGNYVIKKKNTSGGSFLKVSTNLTSKISLKKCSRRKSWRKQNTAKNNVGPGNKVRVRPAETYRQSPLLFGMSDWWLVQLITCHLTCWAFGTLMYVQATQTLLWHWVLTGIVSETEPVFRWCPRSGWPRSRDNGRSSKMPQQQVKDEKFTLKDNSRKSF